MVIDTRPFFDAPHFNGENCAKNITLDHKGEVWYGVQLLRPLMTPHFTLHFKACFPGEQYEEADSLALQLHRVKQGNSRLKLKAENMGGKQQVISYETGSKN